MVILCADIAMGSGYDALQNIYQVQPRSFRGWFSSFFEKHYEDYKKYCFSGNIKKNKTLKRIEIMETSLIEYFQLKQSQCDFTENSNSEDNSSIEKKLSEKIKS